MDDDEEVASMMTTLKLKRPQEQGQSMMDRRSKKKFEPFPSPCDGIHRSDLTSRPIAFSRWSQTSSDLELCLKVPPSPSAGCFVFSEADRIVVRTKENLHWSCQLYDKIEECKTKVVLKGDSLVLKMKKRIECDWMFYKILDETAIFQQSPKIIRMDEPNSGDNIFTSVVESIPISDDNDLDDDIVDDDNNDDIKQSDEEADLNPFGATISVLEIADKTLKVFVWINQINKESLGVSFNNKEAVLSYQRHSKSQRRCVGSTWKTLVIRFLNEFITEECHWSFLTSLGNTIELVIIKMDSNVWNANSVNICEFKENDQPAEHEPMEILPPEVSSTNFGRSSASSTSCNNNNDDDFIKNNNFCGRDVSTQTTVSSSPDSMTSCITASMPGPRAMVSSATKDGRDERRVQGSDSNNRKDVQKPTCMVSPLSSPPCTKDHQNADEIITRSSVTAAVAAQPPVELAQMPIVATHLPIRPPRSLRLPGFVGLENLGNTCFVNCVIQVLANIPELKEYFISGKYKEDINVKNPLGMGGRLASSFARVIEALWLGEEPSFCPTQLKNLIGQKQSRFLGFLQHDAEELMEFLLDGLHEDLNRVKDKLYTAHPEDQTNLDPESAALNAWSLHKSRNDSFIVDIFQGQYHSRLTCPKCGKVSITFDPFSVVQVPIPKKKMLIDIIIMPANPSLRMSRYCLLLEEESTVAQMLFRLNKINPDLQLSNLRALELCGSRIKRMLYRTSKLTNNGGTVLLCEVETMEDSGELMVEIFVQQRSSMPLSSSTTKKCRTCDIEDHRLRRCTRCFRVSYCNQKCQREDWPRHKMECKMEGDDVGFPFVISLPMYLTSYKRLMEIAEAFTSYSVQVTRASSQDQLPASTSLSSTASTSLSSPSIGGGDGPNVSSTHVNSDCNYTDKFPGRPSSSPKYNNPLIAWPNFPPFLLIPCPPPPLYGLSCHDFKSGKDNHPIVDRGDEPLDLSSMKFLMLLWTNNYDSKNENQLIVNNKELDCDIHYSGVESANENPITHLEDCFRLFTEPEILSPEQSWHCSRCKSECQATKELSLWRLPTCLIIHLKRFGFEHLFHREKIEDLVMFPTRGLDISPYLKSGRSFEQPDENPIGSSSGQAIRNGWQHCGSTHQPSSSSSSTIYDLFGVINHRGGMLGGHYTSYARCYGDEKNDAIGWRLFDDSQVTATLESSVVTSSAYVLFYRQRQAPNITSSGPSGFREGTHQVPRNRQKIQRMYHSATSSPISSPLPGLLGSRVYQDTIGISLSQAFSNVSSTQNDLASQGMCPTSDTSSILKMGHITSAPATSSSRDSSLRIKTSTVTSWSFDAAQVSSSPSCLGHTARTWAKQDPSLIISPSSGPLLTMDESPSPSSVVHQKPTVIAPCASTGMEAVWSVPSCNCRKNNLPDDGNDGNDDDGNVKGDGL